MTWNWGRWWRVLTTVVVAVALVRCASTDGNPAGTASEAGADSSSATAKGASPIFDRVVSLAAADGRLAAQVAPKDDAAGWGREGGAFMSPGWRSARLGPSASVGAQFPERANLGIRIAVGASEQVGLTLTPRGASASEAVLDGGRIAYPDVYPSTDVVAVAGDDVVEWMYLLRDERAPSVMSLDVALGSGIVDLRLENTGALAAVDARGDAQFRITRPSAIDAQGQRRDAGMEYRDGQLRIQLDTRGLTFPVLLDPAIETAAWELRSGPPPARFDYAMAYDSARARVVVFGGLSGSTYAGDTWEFDGSTWMLVSTTGPTGRTAPAAAYDAARGRVVLFGGSAPGGRLSDTWVWDGSVWTQVCTTGCTPPSARYGARMAYDSARTRTVLFGGVTTTYQRDTWEWDGTTWKQMATTGPSARTEFGLAYDPLRAQTVLYGGWGGAYLGDTWVWNGTTWTQRVVSGPPARSDAAMAFFGDASRVVLYGGSVSGTGTNETWEWDGTTWTKRTPATNPGVRTAHRMVAADALHRLVTFGGTARGDTWEWDGTDWSEPSTLPAPRFDQHMAFDSNRGRTVLFGGSGRRDTWEWDGFAWTKMCTGACAASVPSADYLTGLAFDAARGRSVLFAGAGSQTWEWTGAAWQQMCTTWPCNGTVPSARYRGVIAYDSTNARTLLFGGVSLSSGVYNDLWAWNGVAWSQLCTTAACMSSAPPPRYDEAVAYDARRKVLVIFGGDINGIGQVNELWEWDGSVWAQKCTTAPCNTNMPSARWYAAAAYDEVRGRVIINGGLDAASKLLNDTWEWDGTSFVRTDAGSASSPAVRYRHSMVYDRARRRAVMFGGSGVNGTVYGETWEYHVRGNGCTVGSTCATGFCVDGVCCESAQCGTCQACNTGANPGVCTAVTNADDLDSCTGTNTCDAQGSCRKKSGQGCSSAGECASGSCADGYCCNAACAGGCDECASTPGTCTVRAAGNPGSNPSCGGFACDGAQGSCPTACTTDAQCATGFFCAVGGTCQARRSQGQPCNTGGGGDCATSGCVECQSGLTCTDFVCCGSPCNGACQTCSAPGNVGTCTTVADRDDADTCTGTKTCSAAGACQTKTGQACSSNGQCASGFCADGYCCNAACTGGCDTCSATPGSCTIVAAGSAGASPACSPYVCNGSSNACPTGCGNDADCASTHYCAANGTCQPRKGPAATCNAAAGADCKTAGCRVCQSNNCIDGYCCNDACGGSCDACNGAALGWSGASNGTCAIAPSGFAGTPACPVYACNGTSASCGTACASDAQCATGYYCSSSGTCLPQKTQSQACNTTTDCKTPGCRECATGFCADGVCCNSACSGACDTCNAAGAVGSCTLLSAGASGSPACSPYLCNGSSASCGSACANDAQCVPSYYCRTSDGTCQPDQGKGGACTSAAQCQAGLSCADGVCCDAPCNGLCQACTAAKKGGGSDGTCGNVATGTDPDAECSQDPQGSCKQDGFCNGAGACKLWTAGSSCGADTCSGGTQTGYACDGFGTCKSNATKTCAPYVCGATGCLSTCGADADCVATSFCRIADGTCQADQANGAACTSGSQCASGNCIDGVCCDTACGGACMACSAAVKGAGADGTCGPIQAGADPQNECPNDGAASCGRTGFCNGAGACQLYPKTTACGTTTCSSGQQTGYSCDGFGSCQPGSTAACAPYVCGATACKTTCSADADCVATSFCRVSDGTCQPDQAVGKACTASSQCASGNCVDGVCCDSPCAGTCQACTAAKTGLASDGTCGNVTKGTDPDDECAADNASTCQRDGACDGKGACELYAQGTVCGATTCGGGAQVGYSCDGFGTCTSGNTTPCAPYTCAGNACGATCTDDAGCVPTYYCRIADGTCQPDQAVGKACTTSSQCVSGNCVDGVCCDSPCAGSCMACSAAKKGAGADGTCDFIAVDRDPDNECATDAPDTCQQTGSCDGSGKCKLYAQGVNCGANGCSSDNLSLVGSQCDGLGNCQASSSNSCYPYVCASTACAASCADDLGCAPGAFCGNDSLCHTKLDLAASCTLAHECKTGFCVEGVCCNTACDGICQACTAANKASGADGTCDFARDGVDPHGNCADDRVGSPTSCAHDGLCDGAGACRYYAQGTACGQSSCTGNVQTGHACDGKGTCLDEATHDCGNYACVVGQCTTTCSSSADCNASAFCDTATSECKPKDANGAACTGADTCASGYCVDGVCCDQACGGQCEACDVSTAKGKCSPVAGTPHGNRPSCAAGTGATGDAACAARACDGSKSTASCVGYVGAEIACRDQSCSGGIATFSATCNGQGTCGAVADALLERPCEPYACGATACKEKCVADGDCAPGYKCDVESGKCLTGVTCDGDHTIKAPGQAPTDCRPYKCESGGTCKSSCASVDDCVEGYVCDANGQCASPTVVESSPADGSGCGCRTAGRGPGNAAWLGVGLLAMAARRRRRGRAGRGATAADTARRA